MSCIPKSFQILQKTKLLFRSCRHLIPLSFHQLTGSENQFLLCFLPVYYQSNEWAGVYGIRERDHEAWAAKQEWRCPSVTVHNNTQQLLLLLLPVPEHLASCPGSAQHLLLVEHGLLPAQRLNVAVLDPVVTLRLPLDLLQACGGTGSVRKTRRGRLHHVPPLVLGIRWNIVMKVISVFTYICQMMENMNIVILIWSLSPNLFMQWVFEADFVSVEKLWNVAGIQPTQ